MKRHTISFLLGISFIVLAFIDKYIRFPKYGNEVFLGNSFVNILFAWLINNRYWILFIGGVVFALIGIKERSKYEKRQNEKTDKEK